MWWWSKKIAQFSKFHNTQSSAEEVSMLHVHLNLHEPYIFVFLDSFLIVFGAVVS